MQRAIFESKTHLTSRNLCNICVPPVDLGLCVFSAGGLPLRPKNCFGLPSLMNELTVSVRWDYQLPGALLVFAIENVATARENSTENNTAPVSVPSYTTTQFKETDFTIPNVTVTLPNKTAVNTTSASAFIVIFIIAILCLAGVLVYCCLKKKSRKYSVDLHPKHEDAQIPLSTVDAEVFDTTSVKESADVKQENQQNLSSTQATENPKDKMEGLTVVDLTDGEPTISTKTSMESLDDVLNENNSNNTRVKGNGHDFTELSIDALLLK
ncbi:hypothetical protein cypCar_00014482 [Cyprinus carpio]|nr:hypothetical protein cypCar_00014482 [Cyprinus carpio]